VTISPEKNYFTERKRALRYIHPHIFMCGLRLGLEPSWGIRVRVEFRIR